MTNELFSEIYQGRKPLRVPREPAMASVHLALVKEVDPRLGERGLR